MATSLEEGKLWIQTIVDLERDGFYQATPAQDMLHK